MPKLIINVKEHIIEVAREILISQGYAAFNIRDLAEKCEIGSGTVYNYFPSKIAIANAVIMQDWQ